MTYTEEQIRRGQAAFDDYISQAAANPASSAIQLILDKATDGSPTINLSKAMVVAALILSDPKMAKQARATIAKIKAKHAEIVSNADPGTLFDMYFGTPAPDIAKQVDAARKADEAMTGEPVGKQLATVTPTGPGVKDGKPGK